MPEAQISPVRDPNYEGFNFSQLLSQASQPLATLGQGQLSIAEQNNARANAQQVQQRESDLAQRNRLAEQQNEANITEAQRQKLRSEQAAQAIATVQSRHPDWTPPKGASVEEQIAAAQSLNDEDTLAGVKAVAGYPAQQKAEEQAVLQKYGAVVDPYNPKDPNYGRLTQLVNEQLIHDPTLTTGNFPVLGAKELNALAAGQTPEQVASKFSLTSNQKALLAAAQQARTTIVPQLQAAASQRGQAELAQIQSKYAAVNQLPTDLLNSIGRNQPWLLGRAAGIIGTPATPPPQNPGLVVPPPPAGAAAPAAPPANLSSVAGPQNDYQKYYGAIAEQQAHQTALSAGGNVLQDLMRQRQDLIQKLQPNSTGLGLPNYSGAFGVPGTVAQPYSDKEKLGFAKQLQQLDRQIESQKDQNETHSDALNSLTVPPNPSIPAAPVTPANTAPLGPPNPNPSGYVAPTSTNQNPFLDQPATPPLQLNGNLFQQPQAPAGNPPPSAMNGQQQNPFAHQAAMQKLYALIGTNDPQKIQQLGQYAQSSLGINQQQIQQLLTGALQGDPNAQAKVRQIAIQAHAGIGGSVGGVAPDLSQQQPSAGAQPDFSQVSSFGA